MPFAFTTLENAIATLATNAHGVKDALRQFVDSVRPKRRADLADGFTHLLTRLRAHEGDRQTLARTVTTLLLTTKHASLYADAGILPSSGFLTELYRRVVHRILPDVPNAAYLRDALAAIFYHRHDDKWLAAVPIEDWAELTTLLFMPTGDTTHLQTELLNAINIVSLRLAGLGLETELTRVYPAIEEYDSPFLMQHKEISLWIASRGEDSNSDADTDTDIKHVLVLLEQCSAILAKVRRNTATSGTSFQLTYLVTRLQQTIARLTLLLTLFNEDKNPQHIAITVRELCLAEARKNDIREHITQSMDLVALRVTENAGRTGEHYITETRAEYFQLFRAALGAGVVVAFMAWAKVAIIGLNLPPLIAVFSICAMYASAFVLIHILHFSLATKQPAMTAAAVAATLDDAKDEKTTKRMEQLAEMVTRVSRSQLAAIAGNILLTLPTAILLTYLVATFTTSHIVTHDTATKLLHDADILSLAPFYAAIAGVALFLGGLVSGYFDNKAAYSRIGARLQAHRLLQRLLGETTLAKLARYIEDNLGALVGNAALGFMLGLVGPLGAALGLPLDVRHVTIATASIGLALPALSFDVSLVTVIALVLGIGAIGFFNLVVSFSLALSLAFKARQVSLPERGQFLPTLWKRLRDTPRDFLLPPSK
jgi:site-specific recombinase